MRKTILIPTLMLGWLFILYEYAIRVSDSVIVDRLMHSLAIGPGRIGVLSSAYYIPYILMQIPAGLMIDRLGVRRCWPIAMFAIAIGCYLFAHSHSTVTASIARVLMGFGSAFAWVGAIKIIYQMSNGRNDALFIGISMSLCMIGAILGQAPWLYLTNLLGTWQQPYLYASFIGIVLALLVYIIGQDYRHTSGPMPSMANITKSVMPLLRSKTFWVLILYMMAISTPQNAFSALWANEFFKRDYYLPGQQAASILSLVWFGGLFGAPIVGWISDRINDQKQFLVYTGIITLLLMAVVIYWQPHSVWVLGTILFIIGFLTNISVVIFALASKMAPNIATSSIIGVANMVNMAGSALVQLVTGSVLSFTMTSFNIGNFKIALTIIPILLLLTTISVIFLKKVRA